MRSFHSSAYSTYLFILQWRYLMVAWFISDLDGTTILQKVMHFWLRQSFKVGDVTHDYIT